MLTSPKVPGVLCALVLAGLAAGCDRTVSIVTVTGDDASLLPESAKRSEVVSLRLAKGDSLRLSTPVGRIEVRVVAPGAQPGLQATFSARGPTQQQARETIARYSLRRSEGTGSLGFEVDGSPLEVRQGSSTIRVAPRVDFVVTVPVGVRLELESGSGDIDCKGAFASVKSRTAYGDQRLDGIEGPVSVQSSSGDIKLVDVVGDVTLSTSYGDIDISSLKGRIDAKTSSGDVVARDVDGGGAVLRSTYGTLRVEKAAGPLTLKASSGTIDIRDAKGPIIAESSYGDVKVQGVLLSLDAKTSSGAVDVIAQPGSRFGTGWNLSSSYGDVALSVPPGSGFELDAKTDNGEVRSDLEVLLPAGARMRDGALNGKVGAGGPAVRLRSSSGDILLRSSG